MLNTFNIVILIVDIISVSGCLPSAWQVIDCLWLEGRVCQLPSDERGVGHLPNGVLSRA